MIDSQYQLDIYKAAEDVTKNLCISASAGSGKTTTLLKLLTKVKKNRLGIFLSFSNAIVEELKTRVPTYIEAKTLHSVGLRYIRDYFKGHHIDIVADKYFKNAIQIYKQAKGDTKAFLTKQEFRECKQIESVCSFARMTLTPFKEESLKQMCLHFNLECSPIIIEHSLKLLSQALTGRGKSMWVDFTDMIYIPVMTPSMFHTKYDDLYLDEAQDTNSAQQAMIELMLKPKGRLVAVGDSFQSIYGFSGAGIDAFNKIMNRPNTTVLPLSVSYRVPKSGIKCAQHICPTIEAWDEAIEGVERDGSWDEIREGDMVLSRTTKPLISLYFKLLEQHIKSNIVGKDIEKGLVDFAETCDSPSKEGIVVKMNLQLDKCADALKKLGVKFPELTTQYEAIEEKIQALTVILQNIDNPRELINTIRKIFANDKKAAKLMTIHRSKGLENPRVFVISKLKGEQTMPSARASQEWERIQERNLMFVSRTRHKEELIWLDLCI
jgi:DNA helicase II / ATP-dependent DNA helicase PcrA